MSTPIQATYKLLLYSLIHQISGDNFSNLSCDTPSILPSCSNEICAKKVCAINPECCTNSWDIHCTNIACNTKTYINGITENGICESIGSSCNTPSCNIPHSSGGCKSSECTNKICSIVPECCTEWTDSCAIMACDINNGICNNINACTTNNNNRKLLQTVCSNLNVPCPGNQYRNPNTCNCECDNSNSNICPGNQIFSGVLCECGCSTAPTCNSPKQFNVISCQCECPKANSLLCSSSQTFDSETCKCIENTNNNCNTFDPCPGLQQRNPITCNCECDNVFTCPGNQLFNGVSCGCQCPITPTCITPKSFNPITCQCECDRICNNNQILNDKLCICENIIVITPPILLPCPGGIQIRNPISNECECESTSQCPGQQELNILCECQCNTTPICNILQQFNPINCACECINAPTCQPSETFDVNTCQCITPPQQIQTTQTQTLIPICSTDPCPGNQLRNINTCECECDYQIISCPGNQKYNVFCECGCPITPICSIPKQFNDMSCQCECSQVLNCDINQIFNTNTCQCDTIDIINVIDTTDYPTEIPTIYPTISPTSIPTITPSNSPTNIPSISPSYIPSISPTYMPSISPTNNPSKIPTNTPSIITNIPTNIPSNTPTNSPTIITIIPTITPSNNPSKIPTNIPTTTPTNIPSNIPTNIPTVSPTKFYPYVQKFIVELQANYNQLIQHLNIENVLIEDWAIEVIKQTVYFDEPIIANNIRIRIINISNILRNIIVIEYTIEASRVEVMDIILDRVDSNEAVHIFGRMYEILSNDIYETDDPTHTPTPEPIDSSYIFEKKLIFRLAGDYNLLMDYLTQRNMGVNAWGMSAVKSLIHYNDPIIESNTQIIVNNIQSGSIIVEYTLEMKRIEVFDIILNNIYSSNILIVNNYMFNILENQIITTTTNISTTVIENECSIVGEQCNNILKCCQNGVICMAETNAMSNTLNVNNGICCIDYNNDGCVEDNDCCYENSYCDKNKGICYRKGSKNDGIYDPSDSKENDNEIIDINKDKTKEFAILNDYDNDNNNYKTVENAFVLSPMIKILLVILIIFVICFNGICFIYNKRKKLKQEKCMKSKRHIDVNII